MADDELQIHQVAFEPDGSAVIAYMLVPGDIRVNGSVMVQHSARLDAAHPDYAEDIESLRRRAAKVLTNALDDFESSDPIQPPDDEDPDEDRGMGE